MDGTTEGGLVETLVAAFSEGTPAGEDLRADASPQSLYFRLRDARAEARAAERMADNDPSLGGVLPPQWKTVEEIATEILATRSKDIEVACWLTESLTRRSGLVGLAEGTAIIDGLIAAFWSEGLLPAPEEDDPEGRLAAVTGLSGQDRDGSLLQPLRKTALFARGDGTEVTLWDYERSASLVSAGAKNEASKAAATVIPFADLEALARGAGLPTLRELAHEVHRAEAAWKQLEQTIGQMVPSDAQPSTGRVRGLLENLRQIVMRYVPAEEIAAPIEVTPADEAAAPAAAVAAEQPVPLAAQDREALLSEVLRIAAAFKRSEPNSPIGFTLEEAVRRARMPWPDLLRELVADSEVRSTMMTTVGMRPLDVPVADS